MTPLKRISFTLILSVSLFAACSNGSSTTTGNTTPVADASAAPAAGNASWSATIDGQAVSGNGIDEIQLRNTAFHYPASGDKDKYILFTLTSDKKGDDFYGFRFYSPDKEGTFQVADAKKNGYRCSVRLDYNLKSVDNFAIYTGDAVTLVITKLTSTGMSGTFSGTFNLSDLSRSKPYKNQIIVDGKFDIPFSTGNMRWE